MLWRSNADKKYESLMGVGADSKSCSFLVRKICSRLFPYYIWCQKKYFVKVVFFYRGIMYIFLNFWYLYNLFCFYVNISHTKVAFKRKSFSKATYFWDCYFWSNVLDYFSEGQLHGSASLGELYASRAGSQWLNISEWKGENGKLIFNRVHFCHC